MLARASKIFGRAVLLSTGAISISRKVVLCDTFEDFTNDLLLKNQYVVFNSVTHKAIFQILDARSRSLQNNKFKGRDGSACSLLQGAKGIGKSEMLMAFKDYCTIKYPDVIPVYITYSDMSSKESLLHDHTVLDIVKNQLKSIQIETAATEKGILKGVQIAEVLEKHGKFVLLLVDEFDELYRVQESIDEKTQANYCTCRSTLGDLNWLGNQKTGRFAVLLCGSSASCPLLVTLDASREEFPLQNHSPHLNETKFKTRRLPANPFLDMEVSKQMLHHFLPHSTDAEKKLITFCVGMNPRKFSTLAQSIQEDEDMFSAFHNGNHESGIGLAGSVAVLFRDKLLIKMREKNGNVYNIIKDDLMDAVDGHKVMDSDWISHFQPLTISEVKSVWVALNDDKVLDGELLKKMQQALFFLSDKDQLSFSEISGYGLPPYIYPMSGAQVFVRPDYDHHQQFIHHANKIFNSIKQSSGEVKDHLAKSIATEKRKAGEK
eukprot:gene23369-30281_t